MSFRFALFVSALVLGRGVWAESLVLNGLASYQHLSREYYLAALYTERPFNSLDAYREDEGAKKLVIKVTTERWSPRRFNLIWKQDIAINNDLKANPVITQLIQRFTETPLTPLTVGDLVEVELKPGNGSVVSLNGRPWLRSDSEELFHFIANAWLGDIPASQRFQSQLLVAGELDTAQRLELLPRFDALTIDPQRTSLLSEWRQEEEAEAIRQSELKRQEEARLKALAAQRQRDAEALAQAKAEADRLAAAKARAEAEAAALATARAKARAEAEALAQARAEAEALAEARAEAEALRLAEQRNQQTAERKAYQWALYQWNVQRQVYPKVTYPDWARQLSQEGEVQLDLVLSKTGQLLAVTGMRPADAGLLGQSLRAAVESAAPFGPLPSDFVEEQYRVTLRYTFRLAQPRAVLPPKPQPPAFMAGEEPALTDDEKAALLAGYQSRVREQVLNAVEYPYWAESLGQEGRVGVAVRVSADGTLVEVRLEEASRHAVLNKELQDAAGRAAPFEAIPDELGLARADIGIVHEFTLK